MFGQCLFFYHIFLLYLGHAGKSYGQKRPPLTHILQSILERYPDGGQILKVYNDANNKSISFLLKNECKNVAIFLARLQDCSVHRRNFAISRTEANTRSGLLWFNIIFPTTTVTNLGSESSHGES